MNKTILISLPLEELQGLIIDSVNSCLEHHQANHVAKSEDQDEIFGVKEASEFLNLAVPTIYSLVSTRNIPHAKRGKKLYFSKADLTAWIKSGNRKTVSNIQSQLQTKNQKS